MIAGEKHWKQGAKTYWLKGGDLNTIFFFYQSATTRSKRNKILGLFDKNDMWVSSQVEVEGVIREYFSSLFEPTESLLDINHIISSINRTIFEEDNVWLRKFKSEEF